MAVLPEKSERRKRYRPQVTATAVLTPAKLQLLQYVAEYRIISLPQLARLACPSEKSARRHMRVLFDAGWVEVVPVSRVALADPAQAHDPGLLCGSAPNTYVITRAGLKLLDRCGLIECVGTIPEYGPQSSPFLAHELAIRDVRIWLELAAREASGHQLLQWRDGRMAEIALKQSHPTSCVRPDAWFVYQIGSAMLVGLLEVDRGTERGPRRWTEKVQAYDALFRSDRLRETTGYVNARVLVVAPTIRRRDQLAELIRSQASSMLAERFWLSERSILETPGFREPVWRRPANAVLLPLVAQNSNQNR